MMPSRLVRAAIAVIALTWMQAAGAVSAPDWMRAQVSAPLPAHDDETDAVLLYSEIQLTVQAPGKMRRLERYAYRILRREGESYGTVHADYSPMNRIIAMRAWSIPAEGKDYEVKQKDIVETGITDIDGGELVSDVRRKILLIPAATPGSIVGYEIEQDLQPYAMTDDWDFQDSVPVRESHYSVTLPAGWAYKAFWINHPETAPVQESAGISRWTLNDIKPVKLESNMPPWRGIAGRMVISLQPPDGKQGGFQSWNEVGTWYLGLANGRRDASADIRQKVQEITKSAPTQLAKMQALASFVQKEIRYVAIELGVGGVQPHPAADVFSNRYGDCKDKATLLSSMLKEIGVESHYVIINTERGAVVPTTPPNMGFNHAILAIQLPAGVDTATLPAVLDHKTLGKILFFDPTSHLIPFGYLPGGLQANTAMLVTPAGGELITLPQIASALNGVQRTAKMTLDENGGLRGEVRETYLGDEAAGQRWSLRTAKQDVDQIKPVERMLAHSISTFAIEKASVRNLQDIAQPLVWNYTLVADRYAKNAGDLVLVRPRLFGTFSSSIMESKEARSNSVEFEAPLRNTDVFEITLPAGYAIDELPPPVNEDIGFVSYRSATEFKGNLLRYTRTLEVKELSLPVAKADALKHFFRTIENDERMSAVLKHAQ